MANLCGDVVTTIPIPAAASGDPAAGINGWSDYTEYGAPRTGSTPAATGGAVGSGWLGTAQCSTTTETAGLTLMGDRLYNASTGRFTCSDPEPGGSAWAYGYPNDPINMLDLDGRSWWRKALKYTAIGAGIVGALACGASAVCGVAVGAAAGFGAYSAMNAGRNAGWSWRKAGYPTAAGAASGLGWGRIGRFFGHSGKTAKWLGVTPNRSRTARGTDFYWRGVRKSGVHSHRISRQTRLKYIHYHIRREGPKGSRAASFDERWPSRG